MLCRDLRVDRCNDAGGANPTGQFIRLIYSHIATERPLADCDIQFDLDSRFADIMELCLYNSVLTSMSHDGRQFTYINQLASSASNPSKREEWFTCACCPPNVLRLFGQLGGYVWRHRYTSESTAEVAVHLYIPGTLDLKIADREVKVKQETEWPWKGEIHFSVEGTSLAVDLKLRVPSWASSCHVSAIKLRLASEF